MKFFRSQPDILITGLAKTGTTILFSRIRESVSPRPLTFFEPTTAEELNQILKQGKRKSTLTKCLAGHVMDKADIVSGFTHPLLIIRDPRDQFVSEMLYEFFTLYKNRDVEGYRAAASLLEQKVAHPEQRSCRCLFAEIASLAIKQPVHYSLISLLAEKYQNLEQYRDAIDPFVVKYEDIIDDNLAPLAAYLGVKTILPAEVDPEVTRVRRTSGYGEWRQWFTPEDVEEFESELGEMMRRHGYGTCELPQRQVIPAETSLDYIRQFLPES
ncbi:hypothetical protein P3T73_14220 [Kiritimatiellota bacterium B12222]|nr:hypothetical protein P3T73_14220 [Kiritimatiellota bacterium B12222]